jgi:hypothetical protein
MVDRAGRVVLTAAVEGPLDEVVVRRVAGILGLSVGVVYGRQGCGYLDKRIGGYNQAAEFSPWVVLRDLDSHGCAAELAARLLPARCSWMVFRVVVREIEAWLLADAHAFSRFAGVAVSRIPTEPEELPDPKSALIELVRTSRRRDLLRDIVPREGSGRAVGPAYIARLTEFVTETWDPSRAEARSASLRSLNRKLRELAERWASSASIVP